MDVHQALYYLLGSKLATPGGDKFPLPSQVYLLLGTKVYLTVSPRETRVLPSRVDSICCELKQILSSKKLSKGHASEICGKLSFSLQVSCLVDLDACILCHSNSVNTEKNGSSHLTPEIERAIGFWLSVLPRGPIWSPLAPGGVHQPRWFQVDLPPSVLEAWSRSTDLEPQRHINKIEAIVPAICLCTWPKLIRGSLWLHFIDNDGALACIISGYSKNSSFTAVVDYIWAQIPALGCWPWFDRVPSVCNIVDGLSRRNFSTAQANNWLRDSAQLPEPLLDLTPALS